MLGSIEIHSLEQDTYEVSMIYDNLEILYNPELHIQFPTLYKEIKEHDAKSTSSFYELSSTAYSEYMRYINNKPPIPFCGGWTKL